MALRSAIRHGVGERDLRSLSRGPNPDTLAGMDVNFRHASGEPVQLAFDPEFDAMIERAEVLEVAGIRIAVVRKED